MLRILSMCPHPSNASVDVSQEKSKVGLGEVCASTLYSLKKQLKILPNLLCKLHLLCSCMLKSSLQEVLMHNLKQSRSASKLIEKK